MKLYTLQSLQTLFITEDLIEDYSLDRSVRFQYWWRHRSRKACESDGCPTAETSGAREVHTPAGSLYHTRQLHHKGTCAGDLSWTILFYNWSALYFFMKYQMFSTYSVHLYWHTSVCENCKFAGNYSFIN